MGQYWRIFNFDDEEALVNNGGLKLGEFFWSGNLLDLIRLLARPMFTERDLPYAGWSINNKGDSTTRAVQAGNTANSKTSAPVLRLPKELITMVVGNLDCPADILCLCLAHSHFGTVAEHHINKYIFRNLAPWAHKRIACLGGCIEDDDYPAQLKPFVEEWKKTAAGVVVVDDGEERTPFLREVVDATYVKRVMRPPDVFSILFNGDRRRPWRFLPQDGEKFYNLYNAVDKVEFPTMDVLINISKHEYIRNSAITALNKRLGAGMSGSWDDLGITLAQALLSKICWSSSASCSMGCDETKLSRGPWAGDCFEVTSTERFEALLENDGRM